MQTIQIVGWPIYEADSPDWLMTLDPDVNDRKFEFRAGPAGATIAT
jgi:hypothetical protein